MFVMKRHLGGFYPVIGGKNGGSKPVCQCSPYMKTVVLFRKLPPDSQKFLDIQFEVQTIPQLIITPHFSFCLGSDGL